MATRTSGTVSWFPAALLVLFAVLWLALAVEPHYRQDWWLENLFVFAALPLLVWSHPRLRFSDGACLALFLLLVLHEIGAHHTYSEVPYDRWCRSLLGISPDAVSGSTRNHYDRFVHLMYGLLATPAAVELIDARAPARGLWRWLLPVSFVASHSVLYELAEWGAALVFGGDLGVAYLGTQGDVWDAQADMALALLGSIVSATVLCAWRPKPEPVRIEPENAPAT